ncbi:MAG: hypothetical protein HEQ23_09935 [Tepidisphaera sp.]
MKPVKITKDPIVAEVHKVRDTFAKRHGYDVDKIIAAIGKEMGSRARSTAKPQGPKKTTKRKRRAA